MLDLYLFNGVQERSTRQFADDLHSFDEDRGTRDGLENTEKPAMIGTNSNVDFEINSVQYEFDESRRKVIAIIQ